MVDSNAAITERTALTSTPEVAARWAARLVLLNVSLMGLTAATGLAAAALGAAFFTAVAGFAVDALVVFAAALTVLVAAFAGADFFAVAIVFWVIESYR